MESFLVLGLESFLVVLFRAPAVSQQVALLAASMAGSGLYPILVVVVGLTVIVFLVFVLGSSCFLVISGRLVGRWWASSSSCSHSYALCTQSFRYLIKREFEWFVIIKLVKLCSCGFIVWVIIGSKQNCQ